MRESFKKIFSEFLIPSFSKGKLLILTLGSSIVLWVIKKFWNFKQYIFKDYRWIIGVLLGILSIVASFVVYYFQRIDDMKPQTNSYYFTAENRGKLEDEKNLERANCWITSLASNRHDAFRCMVVNTIYDPCFINAFDINFKTIVYPIDVSGNNKYFKVDSSEKIFNQKGETYGQIDKFPWYIKLSDNTECRFITGATNVIADMRIDYACYGDSNISYLLLPVSEVGVLMKIGCYKDKDYKIASCDIKEAWY